MFDQAATGRFIAECRKERGLTQRELAEQLSISDKTVSKWETGNGMPDSSMMQPLCELLGINVNELLSAERLSEGSYSGKAEKNMVELMRETENVKERAKGQKAVTITLTIIGLVLTLLFIVASAGLNNVINYIDTPSFLWIIGIELLSLGLAGRLPDVGLAVSICFGKRRHLEAISEAERRQAVAGIQIARRVSVLAGALGSIFGFIMMLFYLSDPSSIGPSIAVATLTLFYGLVFAMICLIIEGRITREVD